MNFYSFIQSNLRGAGQVLFQENALTGAFFLTGIFWGAGSLNIIIGTILGLFLSTLSAHLLKFDKTKISQGLYGYNGILVGIALPTFIANAFYLWPLVFIGSIFSVYLTEKLSRKISPLTFPFVLVTWVFLLITPISARTISGAPAFSPGTFDFYCNGIFKGLSQIFLIDNSITGIIFLIGLFISSRKAAYWALVGSILGLIITNAPSGLGGYNPALTAIAIGSIFYKKPILALLAIALTIAIQFGLPYALSEIGLPIFTAPFIFSVWIIIGCIGCHHTFGCAGASPKG